MLDKYFGYAGMLLALIVVKHTGLDVDADAPFLRVAFAFSWSQVLVCSYLERVSMFSFVSFMVSVSSLMYIFAKWSFDYPSFTAVEIAMQYWIFLLVSVGAFCVSRKTKAVEEEVC